MMEKVQRPKSPKSPTTLIMVAVSAKVEKWIAPEGSPKTPKPGYLATA